VQVIYFK